MLGVRFEYVPTDTWSESVAKAREGRSMCCRNRKPELNTILRFTKSYLLSPVVIVMQESQRFVDNIDQIAGRRIAVIRITVTCSGDTRNTRSLTIT